jgi:antirestriction protein ArdC
MKYFGIHTQEVAERIVNAFRHPDTLPTALAPIFIHRKDDVPCRKWSWQNQLIAALCGTADARGFRQWQEAGRNVKKGSKAIWILAPCVKNIKEKDAKGEEVERRILFGFKSIAVFAVEDTEGEPLPATDDRYNSWMQELPLLEVAKAWNITVGTYTGSETTPLGYFKYGMTGQAVMLGVENLSTWAHEMVHAADHRLAQDAKNDRAHKEVVAELGGAVLLECLSMSHDADLGGAYAYIQRYAEESKKDVVGACVEVLNRVCNSVKLILDTAEALQQQCAVVAA